MTDEQWEQIKPFVEKKVKAEQRISMLEALNESYEPRKNLEDRLDMARAQIELDYATKAFEREQRKIFGP